jgi:raffinose/stachyose/melibiose transport system substrate-binding protein
MEVKQMTARSPRRTLLAVAASGAALSLMLAGCAGAGTPAEGEPVELTMLVDDTENTLATSQALVDAFMAANDDITIELETRPGGGEGDNIVKTRLATGEMADLFWYNSGSLLQALNPDQTLLNIADEDFVGNISETFVAGVSTDNGVYGVPAGTAMGGGVLYNTAIYDELGLEVPTTWDDFMANNAAIDAAGYDAVIQTYADTWTSQLFVLADFANVLVEDPEWAEAYTANERKYAEDEVAIRGFENLQEVFEAGYLNEDFASATFDDGMRKVALGEGAHYPMLTFAVPTIVELYPAESENVGFFALPGENAENPLTTWLSAGLYAPADTEFPDAVKRFMAFVASVEGCDVQTAATAPAGPYFVEGCTLPDEVARATADLLPYFDREGGTAPALEFLSPIKGPALEQITVEVGSGIRSAADGAALYDLDVVKQAQQLGLEGW